MEKLEERRQIIIKITEALLGLDKTSEWQTLVDLVYKPALESIERKISLEAKKDEIDPKELYKLQGELAWAKRFTDLNHFVNLLKKELEGINNKIN